MRVSPFSCSQQEFGYLEIPSFHLPANFNTKCYSLAAGTVGMKPENQVRNCWLPTQRMAPGRPTAPEPRNEVGLPETFKSELHGTPVILDIRNLAKRATNLVYLVRVAIGQRCQAPTGARD